jgi:hypothetical protein
MVLLSGNIGARLHGRIGKRRVFWLMRQLHDGLMTGQSAGDEQLGVDGTKIFLIATQARLTG